jgi:hypothetical protein
MKDCEKKNNKVCAKCGASFTCSHSADCWCMSYIIPPEKLKELKEKYSDCLCPDCLKEYSTGLRNP